MFLLDTIKICFWGTNMVNVFSELDLFHMKNGMFELVG